LQHGLHVFNSCPIRHFDNDYQATAFAAFIEKIFYEEFQLSERPQLTGIRTTGQEARMASQNLLCLDRIHGLNRSRYFPFGQFQHAFQSVAKLSLKKGIGM
jgi:hypothetical protein